MLSGGRVLFHSMSRIPRAPRRIRSALADSARRLCRLRRFRVGFLQNNLFFTSAMTTKPMPPMMINPLRTPLTIQSSR